MKQPDLGLKVGELRLSKGFTQEHLAEHCEVSPRTIQRIESGEVDPRAYTLQCLSEALDFDFTGDNARNESLWLAALHLSSIVPLLVPSLLIWSWKKNQSYKIEKQGPLVLNFQITMMLLLFLFGCTLATIPAAIMIMDDIGIQSGNLGNWVVLVPPLPMIAIGILCACQGVINTMRSLSNKPVRYALSIPFVK